MLVVFVTSPNPKPVFVEHEMVNEQLRTPAEKINQRGASLVGLELIILLDANPRQVLPPLRQFVATMRKFFFCFEQIESCCEPLFTRSRFVITQIFSFHFGLLESNWLNLRINVLLTNLYPSEMVFLV